MRKLTLSLAAAAAALTIGGAASAQPAPAARQPMTRVAVEQRADKAFDRLDANRDGKLDRADGAGRQKARFDRVDANHDGQVSYAEFTAMHGQRDGVRKQRFAHRGEHVTHRSERFAHRGTHRIAFRGGRSLGMVRLADADRNGAVTRTEFENAALKRFDRLDANHDGTVTRDEAKAVRDNMRRQWQSRRDARQG